MEYQSHIYQLSRKQGAGRNWPDSTATDYVGGYYAEPVN